MVRAARSTLPRESVPTTRLDGAHPPIEEDMPHYRETRTVFLNLYSGRGEPLNSMTV